MKPFPPHSFLLVFVSAFCAESQTPPLLRAADLRSDEAILREAYEAMHPGLYRYNNKTQMDAAFAELDQQLDHDETLQEAFVAFSEFAAKVRCGHAFPAGTEIISINAIPAQSILTDFTVLMATMKYGKVSPGHPFGSQLGVCFDPWDSRKMVVAFRKLPVTGLFRLIRLLAITSIVWDHGERGVLWPRIS